MVTGQRLCYWT